MASPAPSAADACGSHLTPGERALLASFVDRVVDDLGPKVRRILLFGSRARGGGHADSDLDLDLAVFATGDLLAGAHRRLATLAEETQLGHEDLPHLRPILIRGGEPTNPALLGAIEREGIELWVRTNA